MRWITRVQINAILALAALTIITWRVLDIVRANDLAAHESQILGAALAAGMAGIVYVAKLFAADPRDGGDDTNGGESIKAERE